ncbi:Hypp4374 [Branchiostoma lanceolatum]|uniref:Hypp4374 protein n=1 Tax=Branchiostoma lanceolatum TaxID=7740 RepID=A0A8K0A8L3_BRALA|nr:Hypp4374 [Branchiostoma lanceolatum]
MRAAGKYPGRALLGEMSSALVWTASELQIPPEPPSELATGPLGATGPRVLAPCCWSWEHGGPRSRGAAARRSVIGRQDGPRPAVGPCHPAGVPVARSQREGSPEMKAQLEPCTAAMSGPGRQANRGGAHAENRAGNLARE